MRFRFRFPVYSVVERNTKGSVSATLRCPLSDGHSVRKGDETYAHRHCSVGAHRDGGQTASA
eukprot:1936522-Rhodomonas_salina.2